MNFSPLVPSFRPDGSVFDLARPQPGDIVWHEVAAGLAKIARFNGRPAGIAYSVAQHCTMGADALFHESGDSLLAGYFLLHDGREALFGDWSRPSVKAVARELAVGGQRTQKLALDLLARAINRVGAGLDAVIWQAANVPPIGDMPIYQRQVAEMDERMLRAEALALFGSQAGKHVGAGDLPPPRLKGAIAAWGAMKAEEAWLDRLQKYLGIDGRAT